MSHHSHNTGHGWNTGNGNSSQQGHGNGGQNYRQGYQTGAPTHRQGFSSANPTTSMTPKFELWMGDLDPWWDEAAIKQIWNAFGDTSAVVKLIRDKVLNSNAGYCFVNFPTQEAAQAAVLKSGQPIPGTSKVMKLNWASGSVPPGAVGGGSGGGHGNSHGGHGHGHGGGHGEGEFTVFVGDVAPDVTDKQLYDLFSAKLPTCTSARVMFDPATNAPKGYAFVRFSTEADQRRALTEVGGTMVSGRALRVSLAAARTGNAGRSSGARGFGSGSNTGALGLAPAHSQTIPVVHPQQPPLTQHTDPHNTTVFVAGVSGLVLEEVLRAYFLPFGELVNVAVPEGQSCGFVRYVSRPQAELALTQMQGYPIHENRIRLSWGRSTAQNEFVMPGTAKSQYKAQVPAPAVYGEYSPGMVAEALCGRGTAEAMRAAVSEGSESQSSAWLNESYLATRKARKARLEGYL